jgi:hypothetical protein
MASGYFLSIALLADLGFSSRRDPSCGLVRIVKRELVRFAKHLNLLSDAARIPSRCVLVQRLDDNDSPIFWFDLIYQRHSMRIGASAALRLFGLQGHF